MTRNSHNQIESHPVQLSGGFLAFQSNYMEVRRETSRSHKHDCFQVLHVTSGCGRVITDDGVWIVPPNRAVWIPKDKGHRIEASKKISVNNLYFNEAPQGIKELYSCFVFSIVPALKELFDYVVQEEINTYANDERERLFQVILDFISRSSAKPEMLHIPFPSDLRLKKLGELILKDLSCRPNLSDLCKRAGLSVRNAQRLFQNETNLTIRAWSNNHRIASAIEMLSQGKSVSDTALETGFENIGAFSTSFKRLMGISPREFVKK